ncbi:hypothetical protein AB0H03_04290 [Streptomyces sparsogenes]|uniref:hypothetical protein n=1 Tax=Streptomyces sparsogenes TaxID=67365 RepID=UPI0033D0A3D4
MLPDTDWPTLELCTGPLPLDGELPPLVRSHVVADEQRKQRQRSKSVPRVELFCAPRGMVVNR